MERHQNESVASVRKPVRRFLRYDEKVALTNRASTPAVYSCPRQIRPICSLFVTKLTPGGQRCRSLDDIEKLGFRLVYCRRGQNTLYPIFQTHGVRSRLEQGLTVVRLLGLSFLFRLRYHCDNVRRARVSFS